MELIWVAYIVAGAVVGIAVGITGVGGGSLMTPLLLLFGIPPNVAIGTDLLFAAITKAGGVYPHHKAGNIEWPILRSMALGSIPAAVVTSIMLKLFFSDASDYTHILTFSLGVMLVLTSLVLLFRRKVTDVNIRQERKNAKGFVAWANKNPALLTTFIGVFIGVFVTLSSVGAGAIGAAVLLYLYPHLISQKIVGTDIAHAVPLTLIAGIAHLWLGNVDFLLLGCLLIGSLPAIHLGTAISNRLPSHVLQPILASILMILGIKFVFF